MTTFEGAEEKRLHEARNQTSPGRNGAPTLESASGARCVRLQRKRGCLELLHPRPTRSRAYRWGEDGIAGISDDKQHLCFALALWNGKDADPQGTPFRPDQ